MLQEKVTNSLNAINLQRRTIHDHTYNVQGLTPSPPISFTNPATGNRSLHTLSPGLLCQLNQRKRPDDLRSQWAPDVVGDIVNVQGKLCAVALHHNLEISKQLPHVISHTRGSLSNSWPDNISWEQRIKNMPQEPSSPCRHNAPC